jgi:two-component system chemotaxis response regulator CheY
MLKILIAEDDMISRKLLWKVLDDVGECDLVINGIEAIDAYMIALNDDEPYDLVCLDIMMPKVDGVKVLKTIRDLELQHEVLEPAKIIMVTALSEAEVVDDTFEKGADAYATKPLDIDKLLEVMKNLKLIN